MDDERNWGLIETGRENLFFTQTPSLIKSLKEDKNFIPMIKQMNRIKKEKAKKEAFIPKSITI